MAQRIPWPAGAAWRQEITLDGRVYRMRARWNEVGEFWSFDLLTRNNTPILMGIKVVLGTVFGGRIADPRLPQGALVAVGSSDCGCTPGRDDMRSNARVIYVPAL